MVVCFLGLCMFDASRRTFPTPDPILDAQLTVFVTNQQPARCAQPRSNWLPIKARQPPAVRRVYAATSPASKSRPQQQTIPVILSTPVVFQFPWTLTKRPFLGPIGCRSIFFIFCSRTILIAHFCVLFSVMSSYFPPIRAVPIYSAPSSSSSFINSSRFKQVGSFLQIACHKPVV